MNIFWGKFIRLWQWAPNQDSVSWLKISVFWLKNVPLASKKAVDHFNRAIEVLKEIGAKGPLGMAYLDLGMFYKSKKETDQARACLTEAIRIFEQNGAETGPSNSREKRPWHLWDKKSSIISVKYLYVVSSIFSEKQ